MRKKILISGASVAGNTTAWWLSRYGFDVTVIEKAPAFRDAGQNVDVRGAGRHVLRMMGLERAALDLRTSEVGTDWVDEYDNPIARFTVDEVGDGPTAELEIMRGDIARLIYEPASNRSTYLFNETITALEQDAHGITVHFQNRPSAQYDAVIVAEGVGSSTRELIFPGENNPKWMDMTLAYFAIPKTSVDGVFARQYNTVGGIGATLKPGRENSVHVYMGMQRKSEGENEWSVERQKEFLQEKFSDAGWHFPRILEGMNKTDNFYFDVLRQVRMGRWHHNRVVLTGDSAWCVTPLSGIGTTLAIVGGYVLAGELSKTDDLPSALASYERVMRPFVREGQGVPKILPRVLWPHSRIGLKLLRELIRIAGKPVLRKIFSSLLLRNSEKIDIPIYALKSID
ncbi:FAD-binding monooxygenase [Pseudomonas syringae]|jgi:2-polyprenyl-6-methoxyphenol hydroxylase-like FAD-dependent oxidoreductase|uniref:FAD-binding monooxygenase n=1 Tax=Pseudomonas syringae TaxID=317 RepID=A0A9Q3X025_PSESX|nr:FAD-binding monooxygenase [Pseudomonas syringae]MCF5062626.1 FAD-binding monooxygenase [Pseudomonas syringae]MCF5075479.1 FAD-binding monooxygenase [Pseudomonas syringae]MCF5118449.1 FAD-binding monooxygenase [Pseudomonas syringae]MCF5376945.1 FAD-binding monooxygenase [Pseudomonas syringae]